jgi:hypothetical protein
MVDVPVTAGSNRHSQTTSSGVAAPRYQAMTRGFNRALKPKEVA